MGMVFPEFVEDGSADEWISDGKIGETVEVAVRGPQLLNTVHPAERSDSGIVDLGAGDPARLQYRP